MVVSLSNIPQGSLVHKFIVAGKPGRCKLCSSLVDKLEAHHISYSPEITIKLCHDCHHKVHFWPQRLNENQIYLLLEKKYSPLAAAKIINEKILTPVSLSKLVAPSRKMFLMKENKTTKPGFDFEAKKPHSIEKSKLYKEADLGFIKRIKASKPNKAVL